MDTETTIPKQEIAPGVFTSGGIATFPINSVAAKDLQSSPSLDFTSDKNFNSGGAEIVKGATTGADQFETDYQRMLDLQKSPSTDVQSLQELIQAENNLGGQGQAQLSAESQLGLPNLNRERAVSQGLIKTGVAEYEALKTEFEKMSADIEAGAGRKGLTTGAVMGQQGAVERAKLARLNSKASEIGILQAKDLALAGNIEAAQKLADRSVDLLYKDREAVYTNKLNNYNRNKDILEKYDAKRTKALEYALGKEEAQIKEDKENAKAKEKIIIEASPFAPANLLAEAQKAETPLQAARILGKYGGDYLKNELLKQQIQTEIAQRGKIISETGSGKLATQAQFTASGFANRVIQSKDIIDQNAAELGTLNTAQFALAIKSPNFLQPPVIQKQLQAERNFVNSVLRRESGAAISPTEFENATKQYFPRPGDSEEVLLQKKANRDLTAQNLINESGSAYTGATGGTPEDSYFGIVDTSVNKITNNPIDIPGFRQGLGE
jgi:hypothetical protein